MATFTTQQYIRKLNKDISNIQKINRPLALAASTVHDIYTRRIFVDGLDQNGNFIRYKKQRKTPQEGQYSRSYARLRRKIGRDIDIVNFQFEGLLFVI